MAAVSRILSQLHANDPPDPELSLTLSLLHIEYLIRKGDYSKGLRVLESTAASSAFTAAVPARIKLLNLKARIFEKTHQSPKALYITVRAASLAFRSRLLPALWSSIAALAVVLISLNEFAAAVQILEAIVPQVLECDDCELAARTHTALVDANMGLAGEEKPDSTTGISGISTKRKEYMTKAVEYLNLAYEEYERLEDVKGMCECSAKKATIMHMLGELVLANDCAAQYLSIKERARLEGEG
jgi:anaphase-promoting complex subunit 5